MAGVNNPPNLKPLIDNQSTTQSSELTAAAQAISAGVEVSKQAVSAKIDAAKASLETKANQTQQAVIDESAATQAAIAQSVVDSEMVTNTAKTEVLTALDEKQLFIVGAVNEAIKNGLFNYGDFSVLKSSGVKKTVDMRFKLEEEVIYSRSGAGVIGYYEVKSNSLRMELWVDGALVVSPAEYDGVFIDKDSTPKQLRYFESVLIKGYNTNSAATASVVYDDWKIS